MMPDCIDGLNIGCLGWCKKKSHCSPCSYSGVPGSSYRVEPKPCVVLDLESHGTLDVTAVGVILKMESLFDT